MKLVTQRFRPTLESLENRDCPAAPTITLLSAPAGASQVTLYGSVQDEDPSGLLVSLEGIYNGTVWTDQNGNFSITVTPFGPGRVTAQAVDTEGLSSNIASREVSNQLPVITSFSATHQLGNWWLFSGTVSDDFAEGLTVQLGGMFSLEGKTVTVRSDGTFEIAIELYDGEVGTATAYVTDWWHQQSETVAAVVS